MSKPIIPVILSGGAGTRLWPLSRKTYPKQLLPLLGERSLLQETVLRASDTDRFRNPIIIANEEHRFAVAGQLAEVGVKPASLLLEPAVRNTAPAVALASLLVSRDDPQAVLAVLPSDHLVRDAEAYRRAVDVAALAAEEGFLVTFGVEPDWPHTGFGYIRKGTGLQGLEDVHAVERFVEKPDSSTAQAFLDDGGYLWNGGMFVFRADVMVEELERHCPDILESCRASLDAARSDLDFLRIERELFEKAPSLSLDKAVMERTGRAAVVIAEFGWSDIGSFPALRAEGDADSDGNVSVGEVALRDCRNSYVRSDARQIVAGIGLDGMVVVATADAVLVAPEDRADEVRALVSELEAEGRAEPVFHRRVFRPWGTYEDIDDDPSFRVKRIVVKPGGRLSLQKHAHRSEHWVVVKGVAHVTIGDREEVLTRNQSTYVPIGEVHRLENRGADPLHLVEVQVGDYVGEDDIERVDDVYGR